MSTTPPPKTRRCRAWVFTLNNPSAADTAFFSSRCFIESATHFVCQLESGEGDTPHIQGFVRWRNAKAFAPAKKLLRDAHIEAARGSLSDNRKYCTKLEGRIQGPWQHGFPEERPLPTVLYPWQASASSLVTTTPDDRHIFWFWEPDGNSGKTVLQWLWARDFDAILVGHNARDAKCAVKLAWFIDGILPEKPIIMLNLPRESQSPLLFHVLEALKDGIFFSGKYKSSMVKLPLVHVCVFANEPPQHSTLSADKLRVFRIDHAFAMAEEAPEMPSFSGFNVHS